MRYRTFIAIDVSSFTRDRLRGLQSQLAPSASGVRWVDDSNFHLTLIFMGDVNERDVIQVCRAVEAVCKEIPPFSFTLTGLGAFPNTRRPRTLIAQVDEGSAELIHLHSKLEPALLDIGGFRREERTFTPHVTIGRVNREGSSDLPTQIQRFAGWQGGESKAREVCVMASDTGPSGREYTVLGRAKLLGRPAQP